MATFRDATGRNWTVVVNVGTVKRVRDAINILLTDVLDKQSDLLFRIQTDQVLLADLLYWVCKAEADSRGLTQQQFDEQILGNVIDEATVAFTEAIANFFGERQRTLLAKAIGKMTEVLNMSHQKAAKRLDSPATAQAIAAALDDQDSLSEKVSMETSSPSPESAG